jgi:alpha-tubulin suppressor-like RCC1 family protein
MGKNEFGQLGIGGLNPVHELKYNSMYDGVAEVACGENFTIYRLNDGSVCGAGSNNSGELGTGDKTPQRTLNVIWGLENIKQIAAGKRFAAALDVHGHVYVWGDNSENQIMKEDINESLMPTRLEGIDNVKEIVLGSNFGLALKFDGTVMAWGDNSHGQLGIGYKGHVHEPVVTLYKNVKAIAAGDKFSLVVTDKGHVLGSGYNAYGQLGVRGKSEVLFPVEILKIKDIQTIKAKDSLVIAVSNIGKAYVWGNFNAPGVKPIHEPEEIVGIQYIQIVANNGKKCFVIDDKHIMYTISNSTGKHEMTPVYDSFNAYKESNKI